MKNKKLEISFIFQSLFLRSAMDKPRFKAVLRKEMYNVPAFANKHKISALTKMIGQQIKENPSLTQTVTDCLLWRGTVVSPKLPTISLIESLVQNHRDMLLSPISSIVSEVFQSIFKSGNERVWIRTKLKIVLFRTKYFRLSLSFVQPVGLGITCSQRLLSIPLMLQWLRWTVSGPFQRRQLCLKVKIRFRTKFLSAVWFRTKLFIAAEGKEGNKDELLANPESSQAEVAEEVYETVSDGGQRSTSAPNPQSELQERPSSGSETANPLPGPSGASRRTLETPSDGSLFGDQPQEKKVKETFSHQILFHTLLYFRENEELTKLGLLLRFTSLLLTSSLANVVAN